ncbi:MAG: anaerobic ribonucleoside-triphosphate reductase [Clostridium sp.]|uniref:anaerobic ribonucleoside-triphosphate reductase n=1 Tax=Clostridium sp. TaxID=1506 RepID=UPI00290F3A3D|nr:anaerobic ribonucleoside-triphosphate reductase [Clostridium sp.]MDU7336487.1 anaerobic ribonucleoside-triphosphate reductase [Clostridium sp.]
MYENVIVTGGELDREELNQYIDHVQENHPGRHIKSMEVELDGEFVNLKYELEPVPFDRIRRITGYLVGGTDRWNDAKLAELNDRVIHGTGRSFS